VSIRPAPINSTSASATCATTITLRMPVRDVPVRPPSFKSALSSGFEDWSAGIRPNNMPTTMVAPNAKERDAPVERDIGKARQVLGRDRDQ
jgi:hypothetical protein